MSISGVGAVVAVALIQGALVALPRANALGSLRRLRSPAWAAVLPGCLVVGTVAPLNAHLLALGMVVLAFLATPPLAALAVLAVVRGPRAALVGLAVAAGLFATLAGGVSGELSSTVLTAFGALAIGSALARLIPGGWVLVGFLCMCVVDVGLLATGVGQPATAVITRASGDIQGPLFDHARVGGLVLDYPDLVLAAVLGGFVAGQRGQWHAAALVTVLAAASMALTPGQAIFPATVPVAVTLIVLRIAGLPRRAEARQLVPQPATP